MNAINMTDAQPDSFRALLALGRTAKTAALSAGLDPRLLALVEIRASQLNGCAFCLRMHSAAAANEGETPERLAVLAGWRESSQFTALERAALQLAETMTLVNDPRRADHDIDPRSELNEAQYAAVVWMTVVINAWNRVTIASHTSDLEQIALP